MASTEMVHGKNEALEQLNQRLAELKAKSEIAIVDQNTYIQSAQVKADFESYIRCVEAHYEDELAPAEETVKRVKLNISTLITPVKGWITALVNRQREYTAEEKRKDALAKEREQERLRAEARAKAEAERREAERIAAEQRKAAEAAAAEARKVREKELEQQRKAGEITKRELEKQRKAEVEAAERAKAQAAEDERKAKELAAKQAEETAANVPEIEVRSSVPTGKGLPKNQTYFYGEVKDKQLIVRAYETAKDPVRIAFLRRFITVNESEVNRFAKEVKDNDKAAAQLPGVRFYSEG